MFVTNALAIGMSLACIGLYQELATHRRWSRPSKWWGSVMLGLATFAGVTLIADQVSPVALIATCSCAILALSIHGQHPVDVEDTYEATVEKLVSVIEETPHTEELAFEEIEIEEEPAAEPVEIEVAEVLAVRIEEPVLEADVPVVDEPVEAVVVSAEWLNEVIAEGYVAKGMGDFAGAVDAFERAVRSCTDTGLSDMLNEELSDCYRNLPEWKQGA
ncbi:hypothetical protein [Tumebacillus permanentifrigoris]|uniref:Uncharacterized protein n=1 Tax=Tumebacillus permanentifrigoris TaxID=378543 RepID=A0A316D6I7_9BACL|nr:hypothetical protein [Tumebacillus permanentifrigoris]PWK10283.1 hypothetical protein C7459_112104 [Tumebacillus permanentifrigoris]